MPSVEEIDFNFELYCQRVEGMGGVELYVFITPGTAKHGDRYQYTHSRQSARDIVEYCLILDSKVTDVVSSKAMLTMARTMALLLERIEDLEREQ